MSKRYSQKQAAARVVREQLAHEKRRRTQLWTAFGVTIGLVVVAAAGWLVYSSQHADDYEVPKNTYKNDIGFPVGEGPKLVELYLDYLCPGCAGFEAQTKDLLDQWVAAKKIKVVHYTVAILDHASTNQYSSRSAATAACAADEGKIAEYTQALFANQPAEGGPGPSDKELIATGRTVGLGNSFESCVKERKYKGWVQHATDIFEERGLTSTPTIVVGGKQLNRKDASLFDQLKEAVEGKGTPPSPPSTTPGASAAPSTVPSANSQ